MHKIHWCFSMMFDSSSHCCAARRKTFKPQAYHLMPVFTRLEREKKLDCIVNIIMILTHTPFVEWQKCANLNENSLIKLSTKRSKNCHVRFPETSWYTEQQQLRTCIVILYSLFVNASVFVWFLGTQKTQRHRHTKKFQFCNDVSYHSKIFLVFSAFLEKYC